MQAAALDYVKAPTGRFAMPEAKKGGKKGEEHKLSKKLKVGLGVGVGGAAGQGRQGDWPARGVCR